MTHSPESLDYTDWLQGLQITHSQVEIALKERDHRLLALSRLKVQSLFSEKKLYTGSISPGCNLCGQGAWSCLFLNNDCTAECTFCPSMRQGLSQPIASRTAFPDLVSYLDFLTLNRIRGVSFSGGEPLLELERLILWTKGIRKKFGPGIYIWLYTNGDLIDEVTLAALQKAGLDEVRFNICARDYDLTPVALARRYFDTVTVEIPAIPEDLQQVKNILPKLQWIGVNHLNLHQLYANRVNFQELSQRGYHFLAPDLNAPVWESELAALDLILTGLDQKLPLSIHYCGFDYKRHYQDAAYRRMATELVIKDSETITETGYIRRLSIQAEAQTIQSLAESLAARAINGKLWHFGPRNKSIVFHPSLLSTPAFQSHPITLQYLAAEFSSNPTSTYDFYDTIESLDFSTRMDLWVRSWLVFQDDEIVSSELLLFLNARRGCQNSADNRLSFPWVDRIMDYERIPPGLGKIRAGNPWHDIK